jgi:hypothetical protein
MLETLKSYRLFNPVLQSQQSSNPRFPVTRLLAVSGAMPQRQLRCNGAYHVRDCRFFCPPAETDRLMTNFSSRIRTQTTPDSHDTRNRFSNAVRPTPAQRSFMSPTQASMAASKLPLNPP